MGTRKICLSFLWAPPSVRL